jgi:hypothetical protein
MASIFSVFIFFFEFRGFPRLEILIGITGAMLGIVVAYSLARIKDYTDAPKIFISYAHEDKEFAEKLYKELQGMPFEVWWDQAELHVGDDIKEKLDQSLKNSDYLLFISSKNSSSSEWASKEITKALEMKKKILPVVSDGTPPPDIIKNIMYADFSASFDDGADRLVQALKSSRHNKAKQAGTS